MDAQELEARLAQFGVDASRFGQGQAKTLETLHAEILNGEAELVERDGTLIRRLMVLNVEVLLDRPDGRYRLVEDRQVFADGRERRRGHLPVAIAEKLYPAEDLEAALRRALLEELGIRSFETISHFAETIETANSTSFPGLESEYSIFSVTVLIGEEEFRHEYMERQSDKTTYFVWRRA
jgi:hypothetical protein